jgi:hypothetical protein
MPNQEGSDRVIPNQEGSDRVIPNQEGSDLGRSDAIRGHEIHLPILLGGAFRCNQLIRIGGAFRAIN